MIATIVGGAFVLALTPALASAQAMERVEPFAVGTFDIDGREPVGLALREQLTVKLEAANRNLQMEPACAEIAMPEDMLRLIGQYEYGLKHRLYEIVNHQVGSGPLTANQRLSFIHDVEDIGFLAPIRYPGKILNAAVNCHEGQCPAIDSSFPDGA